MRISSRWFRHIGISPNSLNIISSCDALAPNINRFGRKFHHGVLNVIIAREQDVTSAGDIRVSDLILEIPHSHETFRWSLLPLVLVLFYFFPWICSVPSNQCRFLSYYNSSFATLRYFGFGCTTIGEHCVISSSVGTVSNIHHLHTGLAVTSVVF